MMDELHTERTCRGHGIMQFITSRMAEEVVEDRGVAEMVQEASRRVNGEGGNNCHQVDLEAVEVGEGGSDWPPVSRSISLLR
jgi:hypothetical protein